MKQSKSRLHVLVATAGCWGRVIGEDSDEGACQLCVEMCPDVFEKPLANRCAQVRPGVDPTPYVARIRQAAKVCPVNAIHLVKR
jgi:ferredoxin